jgi:hypothetical protein
LGRQEEALQAIQEAVELRRRLAADDPSAFNPDLAASLTHLSNGLLDLDRREEAMRVSDEAAELAVWMSTHQL